MDSQDPRVRLGHKAHKAIQRVRIGEDVDRVKFLGIGNQLVDTCE